MTRSTGTFDRHALRPVQPADLRPVRQEVIAGAPSNSINILFARRSPIIQRLRNRRRPRSPADTTVRFGIDGRDYEIDLTDANATELRDLFTRYIPAARKVGGRTRAATSKPAFSDVDPAAVRAWAAANNMTVSPRGRIKGDVLEAYRVAGN